MHRALAFSKSVKTDSGGIDYRRYCFHLDFNWHSLCFGCAF
ncbi:hypothetical protein CEV31_3537 [Brucella thiophenivorans]|uniref:Uncharacterized protein n=1 Tax=Brucella thiophenivorans TaxID=571255 RepID=A0A256FE22_9HYPH|nr:hypothetical protein CEV31_3537 [Brucella thiophenivorans]